MGGYMGMYLVPRKIDEAPWIPEWEIYMIWKKDEKGSFLKPIVNQHFTTTRSEKDAFFTSTLAVSNLWIIPNLVEPVRIHIT